MKTKLSFLVLLLCWGVALTLALAACGGGTSTSEESSSSKGGGPVNLSSAVTSTQIVKDGFGINPNYNSDKIELEGIFTASAADQILTLEFNPAAWVKYDKPTLPKISISLTNYDAVVDLTNNDIPCARNNKVGVIACAKKIENQENCSSHNFEFDRPDSYCSSASGGGAPPSSSSQATWKFGSRGGPLSANKDASLSIPNFSPTFTLSDPGVPGIQAGISVSGGNIRNTNVNYNIENSNIGFDGYPESGTSYPNSIFRYMDGPSQSKDIEVLNDYFIISTTSGDRYLIRVEPKDGPGGTPDPWPKKIYYWKVEEGPSF